MRIGTRRVRAAAAVALALGAGLLPGGTGTAGNRATDDPCESMSRGSLTYETGGAQRVTFAVADAYGETNVTLTSCLRTMGGNYQREWQGAGFAGSAGFGRPGLIQADSLMSPTGSFTVTEAFGRADPGTGLEYHTLRPDSYWGGSRGENYNEYFEGGGAWPDEDLWAFMQSGLYEQAAVINYNRLPDMQPVPGASHAIFLHAGNQETWGCISTDVGTVTRFLQTSVPGDRIVMGVRGELFDPSSSPSSGAAPATASGPATGDLPETESAVGGWGAVALAGSGLVAACALLIHATRRRRQAR